MRGQTRRARWAGVHILVTRGDFCSPRCPPPSCCFVFVLCIRYIYMGVHSSAHSLSIFVYLNAERLKDIVYVRAPRGTRHGCRSLRQCWQHICIFFTTSWQVSASYGRTCWGVFTFSTTKTAAQNGVQSLVPRTGVADTCQTHCGPVINTNTNTNTKYTCDTGKTRNKMLAQWVHLTNHAAGHSRPGTAHLVGGLPVHLRRLVRGLGCLRYVCSFYGRGQSVGTI